MKIFWSWQSDVSRSSNKEFIRDALEQLCTELGQHPEIDPAERPDFADEEQPEVDYDTHGRGGHLPIASTILEKIRETAVFAADITPVVKTSGGKLVPNPNVMLELGYAIAHVGYERLLLLVNTATSVGGNQLNGLPFDLTHCKYPFTYSLAKDATEERKTEVRTRLISDIRDSVRISLRVASVDKKKTIRAPDLSAGFVDNGTPSKRILISQAEEPLTEKSTEEIRKERPLLAVPASTTTVPSFHSMFPGPPASWPREDVIGYNDYLQRFYDEWDEYLVRLQEWSLACKRVCDIDLAIFNRGNAPATDLDIEFMFPNTLVILDADELPEKPKAPKAPPLQPLGPGKAFAIFAEQETVKLSSLYRSDTIIDKSENVVSYHAGSLKHERRTALDSFRVYLPALEHDETVEISYVITANEPERAIKGTVALEVAIVP